MSAVIAAASYPPPPTAREGLIAALGELGFQAKSIKKALRTVNDEEFRPKIDLAIDVTENLLAAYLPEPNHRVKRTLRSLYLAAQNIDIPVEDATLDERTETLETLRGSLGRLWHALDKARRAANAAYPGGDESIWNRSEHNFVAAASVENFPAKVDALRMQLDAMRSAVDKLGRERDTAPHFAQQGELVTFHTAEMTVEINVAGLHLKVNEARLDIGALVDTIEEIREVTADFRATVQGWVDDVTNEVLTGAESLNDGVRRLVSGVRALGGMIGAGDSDAPDMVLIPRGTFMMGIPTAESKRESTKYEKYEDKNAKPRHEVAIKRPFLLGRFPVTVGEYAVFVRETNRGWDKPGFPQTDRHPAVNVGYADAVAYAEWLSKRTGDSYRLPSESEWEYACRAGTSTARYWGDEFDPTKANLNGTGTTEVGLFPANPWGLHDMLGNVLEWVEDGWHDTYKGAPNDGSVWPGARELYCVLRGGSWLDAPGNARAGFRGWKRSGRQTYVAGLRVARTL
jgi:formylglycine-generating enzyme required for sulfatase activity